MGSVVRELFSEQEETKRLRAEIESLTKQLDAQYALRKLSDKELQELKKERDYHHDFGVTMLKNQEKAKAESEIELKAERERSGRIESKREQRFNEQLAEACKAAEEKGLVAAENLHGMYRAKMFDLRKEAALRSLNQAVWLAQSFADRQVVEDWIKDYCQRNRIKLESNDATL